MRVNVYAEEMTDRIEIIAKEIDGHKFTGLRFYLELPVTKEGRNISGPFIHRPGDDDSAAVTFWGKQDLRVLLDIARERLDEHYSSRGHEPPDPTREPEPADDLVEWLNEMRIYEENSEETTEAFTLTIARISADAETIQALREEVARQKLRVTELESWAEAKLAQARVSIERMRVAALMADWDDFNVAIDAALAEFEK